MLIKQFFEDYDNLKIKFTWEQNKGRNFSTIFFK